MGQFLPCFKAYDVRGVVPSELNPDVAYRIGRAFADETGAQKVCIGYDIRLSGPELYEALAKGLNEAGVDVVHLGLVGTEMVYFATAKYGYDGGIMITASHNPPQYNGMKMVRSESRPISGDSGLFDIERRVHECSWVRSGSGSIFEQNVYGDFAAHLLTFADYQKFNALRILANPGNGAAGLALAVLEKHLPLEIEVINGTPDGTFPNGVPNPILEESRGPMVEMLKSAAASGSPYDFGVAWDGDYDRCFFLDGQGNFIEGYYIVGLLAQALLAKDPNQTIIYDPRLMWNTLDIVKKAGGRAVVCKSGHAFIKERMRVENAAYGGEMSAHHYFRGHWFCDSGMIPLMLVADLVSRSGKKLDELVGAMIAAFPCSGEVNSTVSDVPKTLKRVEEHFAGSGHPVDRLDGISMDFEMWRFNLRGSNTEPVIRLNVESRGDRALMERKTAEILNLIRG